ncbi:unnamed protein product [Trichogramma brassicae]|uniref:C2H2-type domain-containing protein n=1 Tax=Trichogramma brassicae TaxID=86971 RepID=A0A6H5J4D7_9HYME|nr:unnamed protein product [Trichogramma brassicae]
MCVPSGISRSIKVEPVNVSTIASSAPDDSTKSQLNPKDSRADENGNEDRENLMSQLDVYTLNASTSSYTCNLCYKNFQNLPTCVRHLLRAHTYCFAHECSYCCQTFKCEQSLRDHERKSHADMLKLDQAAAAKLVAMSCKRCGYETFDEDLIKMHGLRKHAVDYRYVCKCCGRCFKTWKAKNQHEKDEIKRSGGGSGVGDAAAARKPKPKARYVCDECTVLSRSKAELIKHLRDAHNEDFYKNACASSSDPPRVLARHLQGIRLLRNCSHCNLIFSSRNSRRAHEQIHEVAGFACSECGKELSSKDHLRKHKRVHSGERPYPCPECNQAFALRTTMRIHQLSHSGIKPYVCRHCDLAYSQRSALMTHWKSKHKSLQPPPPVEIHHFFDKDGNVKPPHCN